MTVQHKFERAFTLPMVLLLSLVIFTIAMSMMQSVSSVRDSLSDQYLDRLAKQTAGSGVTYANYCLTLNNFIQTWGSFASKPLLTQTTDCVGTDKVPAVNNMVSGGVIRSTFSVGDLEVRDDGAIVIVATGKAEVMSGSTVRRTYTTTLKQLVNWTVYKASVSVSGTSKTCAIVTNELYCWGKNSDGGTEDFTGQLGDGTAIDSLAPVKVVQDTGVLAGKIVTEVVSAQFHSCALSVGKVYCWGRNFNGQLGNGTIIDSAVPVEVKGVLLGKTVTTIGATGNTSCAIAAGKIYCWGYNGKGSVGANTVTSLYSSPIAVAATGTATTLPATYNATVLSSSGSRSNNMCAIADGKAFCWGNNEAGQVGKGTSGGLVLLPTKVVDTGVLAGKTVTAISQDGYPTGSPSYAHVCAVAGGGVYCWGDNVAGQLGRNDTTDSAAPIAVTATGVLSGKVIQDVVVGLQHSCVLANSKVYCWGIGINGQLGNSGTATSLVPVAVSELTGGLLGKTVTAIGGGANRGCAVANFQVYCWGLNSDGQIGDGTQTNRLIPTESIFLRPKAPAFIF